MLVASFGVVRRPFHDGPRLLRLPTIMTAPVARGRADTQKSALRLVGRLLREHRVLRFLLVGGVNTAVGYGLFVAALALLPSTFAALCVSTVLAVLFNFVTTGSYVFHARDPRRLLTFCLVYGLVFAYNAAGLALLQRLAVDPRVAALLLLPGAVAFSYLLNSRFTFGRS
jgi:putative flippase GtrA